MAYLYSEPRLPLNLLPKKLKGRNSYSTECKLDSALSDHNGMRRFGFVAPDTFLWVSTDLYEERRSDSRISPVANDTWLEVTRSFIGWKEGKGAGCWFHVRRGSGVFVNTGKTLIIESDNSNVTETAGLGSNSWKYCDEALQLGYDSIQVLSMSLDGGSTELIYCSGRCADTVVTTACIPELELRTGLLAGKQCTCNPKINMLNCGSKIAPAGKVFPCDLLDEHEDGVLQLVFQNTHNVAERVFHFQSVITDRQVLTQMMENVALPGIWLMWYPWRRILAEQLKATRGAQIDDAKNPIVSLTDNAGMELQEMSLNSITSQQIVYPIILKLSGLMKQVPVKTLN